jgi:Putative phage holin Dp-1
MVGSMSQNGTPNQPDVKTTTFVLSDAMYNKVKFLVQIVLPALSTLYFTLSAVWGLPGVEQVIGTLAALATFFGVLLGLSTKSYNASDAKYDGAIVLHQKEDGGKLYSLELNGDPADLDLKKEVAFKVVPALPLV